MGVDDITVIHAEATTLRQELCDARIAAAPAAAIEAASVSRREPDFSSPVLYLAYLELARGRYTDWLGLGEGG